MPCAAIFRRPQPSPRVRGDSRVCCERERASVARHDLLAEVCRPNSFSPFVFPDSVCARSFRVSRNIFVRESAPVRRRRLDTLVRGAGIVASSATVASTALFPGSASATCAAGPVPPSRLAQLAARSGDSADARRCSESSSS